MTRVVLVLLLLCQLQRVADCGIECTGFNGFVRRLENLACLGARSSGCSLSICFLFVDLVVVLFALLLVVRLPFCYACCWGALGMCCCLCFSVILALRRYVGF